MDLNKVMLIGRLTRDPETRHTQSGAQVTSFTIAVNEWRSKEKENEQAMFIKISAWNKTAELCAQYVKKGQEVLVEGRLKIEEYDSKDGQKRRDPVVVADRVSFGSKPREGGEGGESGGGYRDEAPRSSSQSRPAPRQQEPSGGFDQGGGTEDDLPF